MKRLIAYWYLFKFKRQGKKARISKATTGSLYIQVRNGQGRYKTRIRISDHPSLNKNKNPRKQQKEPQ